MYNYAVIDEFGNADLDSTKDRVSSHFILTAVLFREEDKSVLEEQFESIRRKYFQTGEMKSSKVKNNHQRRKRILSELMNLPFKVYCLVCNKELLFSEGLKYRPVFYKYLHKQLYSDLFNYYPQIHVIADEIGSDKFMAGFKRYIDKINPNELFEDVYFEFQSSKSFVPIQCADFIGGSIARAYDHIYSGDNTNEFIDILKENNKLIHINHWPIEDIRKYPIFEEQDFDKEITQIIYSIINDIIKFLDIKCDDEVHIHRCKTLNYLLMEFIYGDYRRYISADEIRSHLNYLSSSEINKTYFRTNIIASIRDSGIIIASSNYGYKIPSSMQDIMDYLDHNKSIIMPMLKRLIHCQKNIQISTDGKIDILNLPQYWQLGNIVESFKGAQKKSIEQANEH